MRAAPPRIAGAGHARRAAGAVDHHRRVADHECPQLGGGIDIHAGPFAGVGLHAGVDEVDDLRVVLHIRILGVHVFDPVAQLAAKHVVHRVVGGRGVRERRPAHVRGLHRFSLSGWADENVGGVQVRVEQFVPRVKDLGVGRVHEDDDILVVVVGRVHFAGQQDLLVVVDAVGLVGLRLGLGQRRQQ